MRYVTLGTVSSLKEYQEVYTRASGERVFELVEFLKLVTNTEKRGIHTEAKRWINVPEESTVKLYMGDANPKEKAIWAAIQVEADGTTVTLLKIVDTYSGGESENYGLLADALDRKQKGRVI
jgi:hypothetical protein